MMIRYELKRAATADTLKRQLSKFFIYASVYRAGAKYENGAILEVSEHAKEAVDEIMTMQDIAIEYEH